MYWRKWDMVQIKLLMPAAILGVILGALSLTIISQALAQNRNWCSDDYRESFTKFASDRFESVHYEHQVMARLCVWLGFWLWFYNSKFRLIPLYDLYDSAKENCHP